jgi:predicted nucleotidyltransferase
MDTGSVTAVFRALNDAGVRYVVVGGLAVLAHGILRATNDIDIVLDLEEDNVGRATEALSALEFQPLIPVPLADLARAEHRRTWIEEKGARVFHLFSDRHHTARVDIFLEEPFALDEILERALWEEVAPGVEVPFIGLDDLVNMKLEAGRPQDLVDAEKLRRLRSRTGDRTDNDEDR